MVVASAFKFTFFENCCNESSFEWVSWTAILDEMQSRKVRTDSQPTRKEINTKSKSFWYNVYIEVKRDIVFTGSAVVRECSYGLPCRRTSQDAVTVNIFRFKSQYFLKRIQPGQAGAPLHHLPEPLQAESLQQTKVSVQTQIKSNTHSRGVGYLIGCIPTVGRHMTGGDWNWTLLGWYIGQVIKEITSVFEKNVPKYQINI